MKELALLHVNTELRWRGGEAQTLMLAEGLARRGHRSMIAAPEGSALAERAGRAGLPLALLPPRGGEMSLASIRVLRRAIRSFRPDLLHYHTSHAISLGSFAKGLRRGLPAVATRRVSFSLRRNPLARMKYTARVDHLIAVADEVRWVMISKGVPPEMVSVVHSGIDLRRFDAAPEGPGLRESWAFEPDNLVIGSVGHLAAHKGHEHLVDAAPEVIARRPEARFVVIGEGARRAFLEERIRERGLGERFLLPGFLDDVLPALRSFDLFALPSTGGEGSPAVVKEAMACGVPVVAAGLEGVREIVREGRDALLVQPGQPAALARALLELGENEELRASLVENGRRRVREFSVERTVERNLEVYGRVLARHGRRRR
jgi:glycosyltransferase involved in cell wall biosynthesis